MYSDITLRWNHGGRKVFSPTSQRGAKITKSHVGEARACRSGW